ncbi:hypothetical protein SAMN05444483_101127 [Salegentibacter echinorum]|uniref:Uncharacterized protein n=1 Tax=Salegentibacter echinorum TaxID=1073325 RepID=A0A1M5BPP3_SALEC|nr:hypothetical protein SAMN05444483_101127 [Salegentibacter echinorum]
MDLNSYIKIIILIIIRLVSAIDTSGKYSFEKLDKNFRILIFKCIFNEFLKTKSQ